MSKFAKGDRVRLSRKWLDHPGRKHEITRAYRPAEGEIGTVLATPRKQPGSDGSCLDITVLWSGDPKQQRTCWAEFWLEKMEVPSKAEAQS